MDERGNVEADGVSTAGEDDNGVVDEVKVEGKDEEEDWRRYLEEVEKLTQKRKERRRKVS